MKSINLEQKINIALLDDQPIYHDALITVLEQNEAINLVTSATSKSLLLSVVNNSAEQINICIICLNTFEMDWIELISEIRTIENHIKVILVSLFDDRLLGIAAFCLGVNAVIHKRFSSQQFISAILKVQTCGFYYTEEMITGVIGSIGENGPAFPLNDYERDFLKYCCSGLTYDEIGTQMNKSKRTVEGYRDGLFKKYSVNSRIQLIFLAYRLGLSNYKLP